MNDSIHRLPSVEEANAESGESLGMASAGDVPVPYIQRTRDWYLALGYNNPYRYSHYARAPFTALKKPLSECAVALLTTAAPYQPDKGPQGPGAAYNAAAKFYEPYMGDTAVDHDLRIAHVGIDRKHTSMEDSNCWFPLPLMREFVKEGRVGKLTKHFHGVPTNRSQRHTLEVDIPLIVERCKADGADVAVLVPNCPICHQTMSLVARALEAAGMPTVIMGCAKDIVEYVGVPRFLFSDFPLGNGAGKPHDAASQRQTLELGLRVLESAVAARTTVQSPLVWSDNWEWKLDYSNVERVSAEELARMRAENDRAKETARELRGQLAQPA